MLDLFNHPYQTCNLELCQLVIFLDSNEELGKKEKYLDQAAARLTALRQIFIVGGMKNNCSKFKLLGAVQINLQGVIKVVIYES